MAFLSGKRALIIGLASPRSIAAGVANAFHQQGAELAIAYQSDRFTDRIQTMAADWNCQDRCYVCDVAEDSSIEQLFADLGKTWSEFDIVVHSVAFAPRELLQGQYLDNLNREGFLAAHDISSYSFAAVAKAARPMLRPGGSLLTMSYFGAVKAVPNYNVMGVAKASLEANVRYLAYNLGPDNIRVNAVSAGPIKTLAAAGIAGFRDMLDYNEKVTPLRRNVTIEEVGNSSAFLCSDLASGVTGEVLYVDSGFHCVGLPELS